MLLGLSCLGTLGFAAAAGAAGTLMVTPSTGLAGGTSVSVSGSGFTASSTGGILECNDDPAQPTIQFAGNAVPVSCTSPLTKLVTTTSTGGLPTTSFTIVQGTVGPPTTGTDSGGGSAATDAATYPCPPTAAQVTAGDSCVIAFGDQAGDKATQNISFSGGGGTTTTTTTTSTTTTTTTTTTLPTTTGTTVPCTAKSTTSSGSPVLTADPGTCLNGGTVVTVTGSGFDASSAGAVLECNDDSSQPTVALPAPISQAVPVGCSGISAAGLVTTTSSGSFTTTFTIGAGTVGPPCGGADLVGCPTTDSADHSVAADAATYPCPPTAAQLAAGVTCVLAFGDAGGKQATVPISFVPAPTAAPAGAAQMASTNTTTSAGPASTTSGSGATAPLTSAQTLAATGVGPGLWALAIGGALVIDLGVMVLILCYEPRERLAQGGRWALRRLGGHR